MAGIQGRTDMLIRLGEALAAKDDFWGFEGRPGCLIGKLPQMPAANLCNANVLFLKTTFSATPQHRHHPCSLFPCLSCGTS
jgi:hypothetical protein